MRPVLVFLALLLTGLPPGSAQPELRPEKQVGARSDVPGALEIAAPHSTFEDAYQHGSVRHEFSISNRGQKTVLIENAIALDEAGTVTVEARELAPGDSTTAFVTQPLGSKLGQASFRYALITDEPGVARYRFSLSGFVESGYDPESLVLRFGTVSRSRGGSAEIELSSREVSALRIEEVSTEASYLAVAAGEGNGESQSVRIEGTLAPGAPKGLVSGLVTLRTNVAPQPRVDLSFTASVFGDLWASENPINLGRIEIGPFARGEATVRLVNQSGRPLDIERIETDVHWIRAETRDCPSDSAPDPACRELVLQATPGGPGPLSGTIRIWTPGDAEPLPLRYYGIAVAPGTVIRSMDLTGEEPP